MNYLQPDGFPVTFGLNDAARIFDTTTIRLRNYIARDILKHVGQVPLAGQERRFTVSGLFEIGIIDELSDLGVSLASAVAEKTISLAYVAAFFRLKTNRPEFNVDSASVVTHMDYNANDWMTGVWAHRDLNHPALLVFCADQMGVIGLRIASGYGDIEATRAAILKANQPDGELFVNEKWPLLHVLNLTQILVRIDQAVADKQKSIA